MAEASSSPNILATARQVDADSPWLGLLSFTEETQKFFFGRDCEIREIFLRVRDQPLTVLYGQSGYGKTSSLNAGLVPKLRADGFRPVMIRLRFEKEDPSAIGRCVLPSRLRAPTQSHRRRRCWPVGEGRRSGNVPMTPRYVQIASPQRPQSSSLINSKKSLLAAPASDRARK